MVIINLTDQQVQDVWALVCWRFNPDAGDTDPITVLMRHYRNDKRLYMGAMALWLRLQFCHECGRPKGVEVHSCECPDVPMYVTV